jgi:hypothetical protein
MGYLVLLPKICILRQYLTNLASVFIYLGGCFAMRRNLAQGIACDTVNAPSQSRLYRLQSFSVAYFNAASRFLLLCFPLQMFCFH